MTAQSQVISISGASVQEYFWPAFYSTIIVVNSAATQGMWVRCDGLAAVGQAAGCMYINSVTTAVFSNGLPLITPGQLIPGTFAGHNLTATQFLVAGLEDTTNLTQISIASTGTVTGCIIVE
jgi:hypothetical protein